MPQQQKLNELPISKGGVVSFGRTSEFVRKIYVQLRIEEAYLSGDHMTSQNNKNSAPSWLLLPPIIIQMVSDSQSILYLLTSSGFLRAGSNHYTPFCINFIIRRNY